MSKALLACACWLVVIAGCGDGEAPLGSEAGADEPIGADFGDPPEIDTGPDPCIDLERCPSDGVDSEAGGDADLMSGSSEHAVGSKLLVRTYAWMRKQPDASAAAIHDIEPHRGVDNDSHPGQPAGMIPPGQRVRLEDSAPQNGFFKVRYDDRVGWIHSDKLLLVDDSLHPVDFASKPKARDAFFKRQVRWYRYNKDGPASSGNCGPTSLAMARLIFGKEPPGLSIEQSIHQARKSCCGGGDGDGTTASEMAHAGALGLEHLPKTDAQKSVFWNSNRSPHQVLEHVDGQLAKKRVYALIGVPDATYRHEMTQLHEKEGVSYTYTYGAHHDPPHHSERHFILIVSKLEGGKYLVGDPLSRIGMVVMSREALRGYVAASDIRAGNAYWAAP